jgi:hypothetical protein
MMCVTMLKKLHLSLKLHGAEQKVKVTLVQALKAQTGSRAIAQLSNVHHHIVLLIVQKMNSIPVQTQLNYIYYIELYVVLYNI